MKSVSFILAIIVLNLTYGRVSPSQKEWVEVLKMRGYKATIARVLPRL